MDRAREKLSEAAIRPGSHPPRLSEAADVLEAHSEEVVAAYEGRLLAMESPLVVEAETREQLRAQARAVLEEAVEDLRGGEAAPGARRGEDRLSETIGVSRAGANVHAVESLRAVVAFSDAALSVVVGHLPPSRALGAEVAAVAVAIQKVFMERVMRAGLAYSNYLLEKVHESHADERRRISRELHDRVAHSIMVVYRNLELHEIYAPRDPDKARTKLELAKRTAQEALGTARNLSWELRDSVAEEGLEVALSEHLRATVPPCVRVRVAVDGDETLLTPQARDELFLVLREALRNAVAHSGAREIAVEISTTLDRFRAAVVDDGRGFEPGEAARSGNGTGLSSMRERASLLGGTLSVTSPPGGGTKVEVLVPLPRSRG